MIDFEQAQQILQGQTFIPESEMVSLENALGRVLAEPLLSPIDVPPFSKSAMDGFAIVEGDSSSRFRVIEVIPAGKVPERAIAAGTCARIMTGAMIPPGAGRVIRKEAAEENEGWMRILVVDSKPNILLRGEDLSAGQRVLERGTRLRAAEISFLASIGMAQIPVFRRPVVGLAITGSELVEPGIPLEAGKIYNSNRPALSAQLQAMGALLGASRSVADDPDAIAGAIEDLLPGVDMVILSGGVSEGDYDFVPGVLARLGVQLFIHKVRVQPGKPTLFGRKGDKIFFGLPGNPVSAFIIFEVFIKPILYRMMGHDFHPQFASGKLALAFKRKPNDRTQFLPVRLEKGSIEIIPYHGSAHLHALTSANAILILPAGGGEYCAGQSFDVRLL